VKCIINHVHPWELPKQKGVIVIGYLNAGSFHLICTTAPLWRGTDGYPMEEEGVFILNFHAG
jgi:hypothetical protein